MNKSAKELDIISSEMFLKQILSGPYEIIEGHRVFGNAGTIDVKEAARSDKVAVCNDIESFRKSLAGSGKPNVMISRNLLNRTLLTQLAREYSSEKNIIWIND